jgi:hypothetical protein
MKSSTITLEVLFFGVDNLNGSGYCPNGPFLSFIIYVMTNWLEWLLLVVSNSLRWLNSWLMFMIMLLSTDLPVFDAIWLISYGLLSLLWYDGAVTTWCCFCPLLNVRGLLLLISLGISWQRIGVVAFEAEETWFNRSWMVLTRVSKSSSFVWKFRCLWELLLKWEVVANYLLVRSTGVNSLCDCL